MISHQNQRSSKPVHTREGEFNKKAKRRRQEYPWKLNRQEHMAVLSYRAVISGWQCLAAEVCGLCFTIKTKVQRCIPVPIWSTQMFQSRCLWFHTLHLAGSNHVAVELKCISSPSSTSWSTLLASSSYKSWKFNIFFLSDVPAIHPSSYFDNATLEFCFQAVWSKWYSRFFWKFIHYCTYVCYSHLSKSFITLMICHSASKDRSERTSVASVLLTGRTTMD